MIKQMKCRSLDRVEAMAAWSSFQASARSCGSVRSMFRLWAIAIARNTTA
ncbi:hypothetical protein RSSM_02169 [Rhodopirellula sallentina SM41]|uniref:Uncharacterized protein n=1 Tax=Rhodopirellula sallentina SM41 TaxID=1263870 RepID=M5U532_9BACT|nr:hypothetical protein RSSM_02169 [Rhodopirellula sallentina SM41]